MLARTDKVFLIVAVVAATGADGVSAALFHGIVTDPSLPRLVEAARRGSGGADDQMSAADVLRQIADRK